MCLSVCACASPCTHWRVTCKYSVSTAMSEPTCAWGCEQSHVQFTGPASSYSTTQVRREHYAVAGVPYLVQPAMATSVLNTHSFFSCHYCLKQNITATTHLAFISHYGSSADDLECEFVCGFYANGLPFYERAVSHQILAPIRILQPSSGGLSWHLLHPWQASLRY